MATLAWTSDVRNPELEPTNTYSIAGTTLRVSVPEPESWGNATRLTTDVPDSVPEPELEPAVTMPVDVKNGTNAPEPDRLADTALLFTVPPTSVPLPESAAERVRDTPVITPDSVPLPLKFAVRVKLLELTAVRSPTPDNGAVTPNAGVRVEDNVPEPDNATVLLTAGVMADANVPELLNAATAWAPVDVTATDSVPVLDELMLAANPATTLLVNVPEPDKARALLMVTAS